MTGLLGRREFLRRCTGAALALPPAAALLAACARDGSSSTGTSSPPAFLLARQDDPVTLPLSGEPVPEGPIEKGTKLRVYSWPLYIKPALIGRFEEEFDVKVEMMKFDTMDDALAYLRTGEQQYDVFFPAVDVTGKLVAAGMLQPLNHDLLPNLGNVWEFLRDPFYDRGARYTVPYFVWTTGIAWRNDFITDAFVFGLQNPYEIFWDTRYAGHAHLLSGSREALAMALMKNGIVDVNEDDPAKLQIAKTDLLDLVDAMDPKFDHTDYRDLFRDAHLHQSWSGNIGFIRYYAPDPSALERISYWWPPQGGTGYPGVVGSDTMAVMSGSPSPIAAHAFINFLLDTDVALENSVYEGYQPPQNSLGEDVLIGQGGIPESLRNVVVRPEDFAKGYRILELSSSVDQMWQEAYDEVTSRL